MIPSEWWSISEEVIEYFRRIRGMEAPDWEEFRCRILSHMEKLWTEGERDTERVRVGLIGMGRSFAEGRRRRPVTYRGIRLVDIQDLGVPPNLVWEWAGSVLNERQMTVVGLHLSSGWTFARIGKALSMTPQGVHRIYDSSIDKLRRRNTHESAIGPAGRSA